MVRSSLIASALLATSVALTGCGGGSSTPATGHMSVGMTDAPVDNATRVQLTITAVEVKPEDHDPVKFNLDPEKVISNLLDYQGNKADQLLDNVEVPAGHYDWIRFYVRGGGNDSYVITSDGAQHDLFVPGQQNSASPKPRSVQLVSGFTVPAGGDAHFTLETDLRRALVHPANQSYFLLRPAMRITDESETGTIKGTVADSLVNDSSCTNNLSTDKGNAVYLYKGSDAATGDVYLDDNGQPVTDDNPIATAEVHQNTDTGIYHYTLGDVEAGDYTVAFTCQSLDDDPQTDDNITFAQKANVTVAADETTEQDFNAQ